MANYSDDVLKALEQFYKALDHQIHSIEKNNKGRINCKKGCFSCCKDNLEVFGIEAEYIRKNQSALLKNNSPASIGACAFLDEEGGCRIYDARPFVCRTHGVPISYLVEENNEWLDERDICPLNEAGEPLEELSKEKIFQNNPWEEKLAMLQLMVDKGNLERVLLRDLFKT